MADEYILKHLQDVLDAINELEGYFTDFPKRFDLFEAVIFGTALAWLHWSQAIQCQQSTALLKLLN